MKAFFVTRVMPRLAWLWWHVTVFFRILWICRAAVLPVAVGFGLIVGTDQARDIVVANAAISEKNVASLVAILVAVTTWSTVAWYWARVTVQFAPINPEPPLPHDRWHALVSAEVPRLIGTLGMLSVAVAFGEAASLHEAAGDTANAENFRGAMWVYVGFAGLFYLAVRNRDRIARFLVDRGIVGKGWLPVRTPSTAILDPRHGFALGFLLFTLLASPLFYALVAADPVWMSDRVFRGAVPAALLAFALMVPVGSYLVMLSAKTRVPFFGAALVALVAFPMWRGDFHDVRTLRAARGPATDCTREDAAWDVADAANRPMLKQAYFEWWEHNAALTEPFAGSYRAPPLVMVAAAGGASRAAFWTSRVLSEIAAREPHFSDRLFMISGVSGGSLGAVTFRSLVQAYRHDGEKTTTMAGAPEQASQVITNDFLGPTFAAGLFVDLPSNGLTVLNRWWQPQDRGVALEKAWETAWKNSAVGRQAGFGWDEGFAATFGGKRAWPYLVLNGTSVEKGKRILTSNVRFWSDGTGNSSMANRINRYDALDIARADLPISTSVTMSARFPVISPTGALRDCTGKAQTRVTDGGLFENFGAATLDEALRYLTMRIGEVQDGRYHGRYQAIPMAILISSDPSLDQLHLREDGHALSAPPDCAPANGEVVSNPRLHPGNDWPECPVTVGRSALLLVDPVKALYDGRVARGEVAATAVLDRITDARLAVRDRMVDLVTSGRRRADPAPRTPHQIVREADESRQELARRLGTFDHTDFFHFRQCRMDKRKSPTMSWHDSEASWAVLVDMLGLSTPWEDECGNRAEFFRLCIRLSRVAENKSDLEATLDCAAKKKWPYPKDWYCDETTGRCGVLPDSGRKAAAALAKRPGDTQMSRP